MESPTKCIIFNIKFINSEELGKSVVQFHRFSRDNRKYRARNKTEYSSIGLRPGTDDIINTTENSQGCLIKKQT